MSYYAKVRDGKVVQVAKGDAVWLKKFVDTSPGTWLQTSFNTRGGVHYTPTGKQSADQSKALRFNFAGIGDHYDAEADAFYAPQPHPDAELDRETFLWREPQNELSPKE